MRYEAPSFRTYPQGRRRGSGWSGHGPTSFGKMDIRQRAIAATSGLGIDD